MRIIILPAMHLNFGQGSFDWEQIAGFLKNDYEIHIDAIDYWSNLEESDPTNVFKVTPLIREVREEINK